MVTGTTEALPDQKRSAPVGVPAFTGSAFPLRPAPRTEALWQTPLGNAPRRWPSAVVHSVGHGNVPQMEGRIRRDLWMVPPGGNLSPAYRLAKRLLDVVGSLGLLIVLGPIMLAVFLILMVTTRGRPLFWQRRVGYCGRPFWMFKFRTMVLHAHRRQHEVPNEKQGPIFKNRRDPRITRFGRLLRKTSLDETPQLFHVLFGRMSLVGPRPLPVEEVARFKPWQRRRLAVMPGLTCLWQISGRSEIGFEDWVRLDIWYVRRQSLWTDLKLLWSTPASVLGGRGAY